jgi:RNA polymerase sigma factor (sigma-70 family)
MISPAPLPTRIRFDRLDWSAKTGKAFAHGTLNGYQKHGCGCDACWAAYLAAPSKIRERDLRAGLPESSAGPVGVPRQRQPRAWERPLRDLAREEMIESRRLLAYTIANEYCDRRGLDLAVREEVEADALVGLVRGIDAYDPSRGVKLNTYLGIRIRGAILDGARSRHHLKRGQTAEVEQMRRPLQLDALDASCASMLADEFDPYAAVDELDEQRQLMALAHQVIAHHLTAVQRKVVQGHLLDGRTLTDIAGELDVSVAACSQALRHGLTRLRWHMKDARS